MQNPRARLLAALAILVAVAAGWLIRPSGDNGSTRTVTVATPATKQSTPTPAAVAKAAPAGDLQADAPTASPGAATAIEPADSDLRDETPPGVPLATLQGGKEATDEFGALLPTSPQPVGGAQNYTVVKDFTGHVYGDFSLSVTPTEFCLHYTASPNIEGWGDVRGVQGYFIRTRVGSATFIADFEKHILQMVPLTNKAWTQGAFNPYCRASVEIIATGKETRAQWLAAPLIKDGTLASLMRDTMRKYGLPLRFVDPVGCAAPPGYTDHNHIECGNSHTDVAPTFPWDVLRTQLADGPQPATAIDRQTCRKLQWWRTHGRPQGLPQKRASRRKHALDSRNVTCTAQGPVRA